MKWRRFSPPFALFSVLLPDEPKEVSQTNRDLGIVLHRYQSSSLSGIYFVSWVPDLPDIIHSPTAIQAMYAANTKRVLKEATESGKREPALLKEEDIAFHGYQAHSFQIEAEDRRIDGKIFIMDSNLIELVAAYPKSRSGEANAQRFFRSFSRRHLLPPIIAPTPTGADAEEISLPEVMPPNAELVVVDSKPVPLNEPRPGYTDEGSNQRFEGVERIRVHVMEDGTAGEAVPMNRLPFGLNDRALGAAMLLKFKPAMKSGKPVPYWVIVEVEFKL